MHLSLGVLTDLAICQLAGGTVDERDGYLVVRTPDNPTFFWGNFLQILDAPGAADVEGWVAVFGREFPGAEHRAFGLPASSDPAPWIALGYEYDAEETLVAEAQPGRTEAPTGYAIRQLEGDDWDAYWRAEMADNAETGRYAPEVHEPYARRQAAARRRLTERGLATFFGAFHPADGLVASLGIVKCPPILGRAGLARYQHVGTASAHRNRGLASHLIGEAAAWASDASAWVIVTETTNLAGRLYRAAGFTPTELHAGVLKGPPR